MGFPFTNPVTPDPHKFTPLPTTQSPLPVAGAPASGFNQSAIEAQLRNQFGVGDILDGIKNKGGDLWGWLTEHAGSLIPRDENGNIKWSDIGSKIADIGKFVMDHKADILDTLNAVNQYQRQQQSDKYAKQGLEGLQKSYDERAPLRVAGQAGMLNPQANTPDLSALKAQGQIGASNLAPLPVAPSTTNLQNAQKIAGPNSGNPFATGGVKPLPVAGAPNSPGGPSTPNAPAASPQPSPAPSALPVAGQPTAGMPTPPTNGLVPRMPPGGGMPSVPAPLPVASAPGIAPVAQSGRIANGPQDKRFGPGLIRQPALALPVAGFPGYQP